MSNKIKAIAAYLVGGTAALVVSMPIQSVYEGIMAQIPNTQDPAAIIGLLAQASQVQAHAQTIQLCITELRRHDGDDAWERIPERV